MRQSSPFFSFRWRLAQAAEIRWWKRYLGVRPAHEYLVQKKNYWIRVLQTLGIEPQAGQRILDAGCGPAGIFMVLDHCQVDAIDPLLEQYASALPHFRKDTYPYVYFKNETIEAFVPGQPYPLVFCMNAVNHVADWGLSLHRLTAAVAPSGILVLAVDVHRWPWLKYLFRLLPFDILHPHQHSAGDYLVALQQRGMEVRKQVLLRKGLIFNYIAIVACKGSGQAG